MIIRKWSVALSGLLTVLMAGAFAPGALADGAVTEGEPPPPRVELVLDVSGSMSERDMAGGQSRIAAAQQAFNEVLDAMPEEVHLGIRTLGAGNPGDDKVAGCLDSDQLYPVGPVDRLEAKTAVATLRPTTGFTPIGLALREADKTSVTTPAPAGSCSSPTARTPAASPTPAWWPANWPPRAPTWWSTPSA